MKKNNKKIKLSKLQLLSIFLIILIVIPILAIVFLDFFFVACSFMICDSLYSIYRVQEIARGVLTIVLLGLGGILTVYSSYKKCQKKNKRLSLIKNNIVFYSLLTVFGFFYGFLLIIDRGLGIVRFKLHPIIMGLFFLLYLIIVVYFFFKSILKTKTTLFQRILIVFSFSVVFCILLGVAVLNFRDIGAPTIYKKVEIVEKDEYLDYRYKWSSIKLRFYYISDNGLKKYFIVNKKLYDKVNPPETVIIEQRPFSKTILSIEPL
jgi:hypothetical protein